MSDDAATPEGGQVDANAGAGALQQNETQTPDTGSTGVKVAESDAERIAAQQNFLASLPDDFRETAEKAGWNNLTDIQSHLTGLETKLNEAIVKPSDDASPEERNAFYQKLGRPENPSDYVIELSGGLEDDLPWNDDVAEQFRAISHEIGFSNDQFNKLMNWYANESNQKFIANKEQRNELLANNAKAFSENWGDPKSDAFQEKAADAAYGLKKFGGESVTHELKDLNAIDENGNILAPHIANLFATLGKGRKDDQTIAGGNMNNNPFANLGAHDSMERAQAIINKDPDLARRMIVSAGANPADWLL